MRGDRAAPRRAPARATAASTRGGATSEPNARDEYLDASSNARHWSTLRFAQLTIFIALTGGLLNLSLGRAETANGFATTSIKLAGIATTLLFALLQERTMLYWYASVRRTAEPEPTLGFRQYSYRPAAGRFSSRNAVRAFFTVMLLFWLAALTWGV